MQDAKKLTPMIVEGLCYGLTGTIFVFLILAVESFAKTTLNDNGFSNDDFGRQTLAILWVFLGLGVSAISVNLFFRNSTGTFFLRWFLILLSSSILTIVLQKIFLIYYHDQTADKLFELLKFQHERMGLWWTIRLFLILIPFTILFANRRFILEKIKNLNSLK
jgi:hypothetical protein